MIRQSQIYPCAKHGDGNCYINYMDSQLLTPRQIMDKACEFFFQKGKAILFYLKICPSQ